MPCNPSAIQTNIPPLPANPIPGFGLPFTPALPSFNIPFPSGMPEDLLGLFNALQLILPSGTLKGVLPASYGRSILDQILKLMDFFLPFLMSYKFILPILDMIICIIEILCAIPNPFKLIRAMERLFRVCLPEFLSLFPYFAMIVMIISLLLLLLALIEYILAQLLTLIELILKNIQVIERAAGMADAPSILAAINKIGLILCAFQNLFVLLALFEIIIDVIKKILALIFSIPPCSSSNGNPEQCCTPDVCPSFIRNNTTITGSGTFQYYNKVAIDANLVALIPDLPVQFGKLLGSTRPESWQFYDAMSSIQNAFINITQAFDLPAGTSAVFFPTDANYSASTPISQVPYTIDLRIFYNPATPWGRSDPLGARFVRINGCIVQFAPTTNLNNFDNSTTNITNGVLELVGGLVFEDDGTTPVMLGGSQGTLESFIHLGDNIGLLFSPPLNPTDGANFTNVEYTLHINHTVLLSKALITLGCVPAINFDKTFINTVFGTTNPAALINIVNGIPSFAGAQACLATAITALQSNVSNQSVADFQATTTACLNNLRSGAAASLQSLVNLGFDPNQSTFTIIPNTQFTTESILVQVSLNDRNGLPLTANMATDVAAALAVNIAPQITFGEISQFIYDGVQFFDANITSTTSGSGTIEMQYEGQQFVSVSVPTDLTQTPTVTTRKLNYTFIYSPVPSVVGTPEGDDRGKPERDAGDVARESE